jgi:hypothetical protein
VGIDIFGFGGDMVGVLVMTMVWICISSFTIKRCRLSKKTHDCHLSRMNATVAMVVS